MDDNFLAKLRARDEAAFNTLVRDNQGRVYALLLKMLRDSAEAEEVAQEVFVTVFKSIEKFRGEAKISTWIYRIAINHGRNRIKYLARRSKQKHRPLSDLEERLDVESSAAQPAPDRALEAKDAAIALHRAIRTMPEEFQEIYVLRELQGLSYEDIEKRTGIARGTVKSRLHRARLAVEQELKKGEERS